jgi:hypothetical protein
MLNTKDEADAKDKEDYRRKIIKSFHLSQQSQQFDQERCNLSAVSILHVHM